MKSVSTFLRQQLKIKGKSEHNGRGCWEMTTSEDLTYDEIVSRINSKLQSWKDKGLVESCDETVEDGVQCIEIKFNQNIFNPFYSSFYSNNRMTQIGMLGTVVFTIPHDREGAYERMMGGEV